MLWFFLVIILRSYLCKSCVRLPVTRCFGAELLVTDYSFGIRLSYWSTATKLYVNTYHFSEVDPRCLVNCTSKNALGEPLISLTATKCGLKGA